MSWRQIQLDSFEQSVMFEQDYKLVKYLQDHQYTTVYGYGDVDYFCQFVEVVDHPANFGIYILNKPFEYQQLITHVNWVLEHRVQHGLYLAINKFYAQATDQFRYLNSDYDIAINELITQHINANVESYQYRSDDCGNFFNFAHPLNQFYLGKK